MEQVLPYPPIALAVAPRNKSKADIEVRCILIGLTKVIGMIMLIVLDV